MRKLDQVAYAAARAQLDALFDALPPGCVVILFPSGQGKNMFSSKSLFEELLAECNERRGVKR